MKKSICLVLVLILLTGIIGACGSQSTTAATTAATTKATSAATSGGTTAATTAAPKGPFDGVEPLATPVTLRVGQLNGSHHGFGTVLVDKLGGFAKVGIKVEYAVFGNGPVMVEAKNSWDIGSYGIGGTLAGGISQGINVVGIAARDNGSLQFFAKPDSDIVKAGKVTASAPGLYGTAATWKGKEIYLPTGTTLHYTLIKGLEKLGLTAADVKLTHMDVTNINTALMAGQGQVGGLWGNFTYSAGINQKYTAVMKAKDVGVELVTVLAANPDTLKDPAKAAAVKKWVELYFKAVDWLYEGGKLDEANKKQALDFYIAWNDSTGVKSTAAELEPYLNDNSHYTLEENYKMFTTKTADGKMLVAEQVNYDPLLFFIKNGNYKETDAAKFLNGVTKADFVIDIYNKTKK